MSSVWKFIRENIILVAIAIIVVSIFLIGVISRLIEGSKIYNPEFMNQEKIPYVEHQYKDNEYKVIDVDEFDVINYYYRDFIVKLVDNPRLAWDYISASNKKEMFNDDRGIFVETAKKMTTVNTRNNKIVKYRKEGRKYTIIDSEEQMYTIEDDGVWNYKISYLGQSKEY